MCPFCHSEKVTIQEPDSLEDWGVEVFAECQTCKSMWWGVYELTGYKVIAKRTHNSADFINKGEKDE